MTEEWRDIPGWEGLYQASSLGRIRSLDRVRVQRMRDGSMRSVPYPGRIRKPHSNKNNGYLMVGLSDAENGRSTHTVHALVCAAFHGPRPSGMDTAHANGLRHDNRPDNLRWATRSENLFDRRAHGTHIMGERHGKAKLSNADVLELRQLRRAGWKLKALGHRYGIHWVTAMAIANGRKRIMEAA